MTGFEFEPAYDFRAKDRLNVLYLLGVTFSYFIAITFVSM